MQFESLEKEEFWRFVLTEHAQSGLSVVEFCRQEGVSQPSFYAWRKKILQRDNEPAEPNAMLPVKVLNASQSSPRQSSLDRNSLPTMTATDGLEIVTPLGLKIIVTESCSTDLIHKALVAIGSADRQESPSC
jgi:transposase-like protein